MSLVFNLMNKVWARRDCPDCDGCGFYVDERNFACECLPGCPKAPSAIVNYQYELEV